MELRQIWKIFWRWWWLAAIPMVVVAGYVAIKYQSPPTMYQVVIRYMAGGQPATELSADYDRYHAWLSSEYIARGLGNVAETWDFAEAVEARLEGSGVTSATIKSSIVTDYAESVLVVYLTMGNKEQIPAVADAISAEITENGPAYFPQMSGIGAIARRVDHITGIDDPRIIAISASIKSQLMGPALRLILAAGVGLGLIFLAHFLDPMVRERDEIEQMGVPVMGSVPRRRGIFRLTK
ncbi:MAG: hypothetical protein JXA21_22635 [Anaerolineae bacterium]|nr:hypothetical protein [Anaerolineae bacterium]